MRPLVIGTAAVALLLAGCSRPTPEDIPGNGKPGSVAEVDAKRSSNGAADTTPPSQMVVLPISDWPTPEIPVVNPPKVISIWFYPIKSSDGLSWRSGFWAYRVVKEFSWGMEDAFYQRSTPVMAAMDPATASSPQNQEKMRAVAVQQTFVDGLRTTVRQLPGLPTSSQTRSSESAQDGRAPAVSPAPAAAPAPRAEARPPAPPPASTAEALGARRTQSIPQDERQQPAFVAPR